MLKVYYGLLILVVTIFRTTYAANLRVSVEPSKPSVHDESFNLMFEIESKEKGDAKIFFNPSGAKILSQNHGNVSVNATVINGKISVQRIVSHVYTLKAERPGLLLIKDIRVEFGKKTLRHPNIRINVGGGKRKGGRDVLMVAIPSKTSVYLGEGFNVNYYLYYRVPLVSQVTDFFPKLNGFLKRTPKNLQSYEETVEHEGMIYKRMLLYSYRLYPEKTGTLRIDPYGIEIGYLKSTGRRNYLSRMRLGRNGRKVSKRIRSRNVPIEVLPLPIDNLPNNFVGLIGDHDFKIVVNKEKFLVNEVVEVRLEVTGPGALEQFAAPSIYQHDRLESFEVKSSIIETAKDVAKKTFDYTFLTRGELKIDPRDLKIHLFDFSQDRYFEKSIPIPGISVLGGIVKGAEPSLLKGSEAYQEKKDTKVDQEKRMRTLLAPVFYPGIKDLAFPWLDYLNFILAAIMVVLLGYWLVEKYRRREKNEIHDLMKEFSTGKIEYAKVHRFISFLSERKDNLNIESIIKKSALSQDAQAYFIKLLDDIAERQYGAKRKISQEQYRANYFKEVFKLISQKS